MRRGGGVRWAPRCAAPPASPPPRRHTIRGRSGPARPRRTRRAGAGAVGGAIPAGAGPRNFNPWGDAVNGLNFLNPFKAAETMTGHIVRISGGDLSYDTIDYDSIFAIALLLFLMTFALNVISQWVVRRYRQEY